MWLATKPAGAISCARVVGKNLLIPYSLRDGRLSGHYYDLHLSGGTLFGRFEQFDSAVGGAFLLRPGPNQVLLGSRWFNEQLRNAGELDITKLLEDLPGMQEVVWVRMPQAEVPDWAEKYFREEWPNKPV